MFENRKSEQPATRSKEETAPIQSGEIFHPEKELQEIRRAPKEERKAKIEEFKEKLAFQKEGLARAQEGLITAIRKNPDTPLEELYETAVNAGSRYGMSEEQKETARSLISAYSEKHQKIKEVREQYPSDKDLYNALFGRQPKGKVEVIEGPMTLYFRCEKLDDYTVIHSQSFLGERDITKEDRKASEMSGGVSIGSSLIPGLEGTVIAEKSGFVGYKSKRWAQSEDILKHEEQHAMKRIFGEKIVEHNAWERFDLAETDEERKLALKEYFRSRRQSGENRARDEILAFFKGDWQAESIFEALTEPREKKGLYDYFVEDKKLLRNWFSENFKGWYEPLADRAIKDVFELEYKELLQDGIDAFTKLEKSGYSKDQVIAILIHEPLAKWKKVAKRLLEAKKT